MAVCVHHLILVCLFCVVYAQGEDSHLVELSLSRNAFQSTTRADGHSDADLATDGLPQTCSRTQAGGASWWKVDLGATHIVVSITVDIGGSVSTRATYVAYTVFVSVSRRDRGSLCVYYRAMQRDPIHHIKCSTPMAGRYVSIYADSDPLVLCSVNVYECEEGYFGSRCDSPCRCKGSVMCNRHNGYCPSGCGLGWMGRGCQNRCRDGQFGERCRYVCNCGSGDSCDFETGECPGRCPSNWHGKDCQTALPVLTEKPVRLASLSSASSITLRWRHWSQTVAPPLRLQYRVSFSLHPYHGKVRWREGPVVRELVPPARDPHRQVTVHRLKGNAFYQFHIVPYLIEGENAFRGVGAGVAGPFRTNCSEPLAPSIVVVKPGESDSDRQSAAFFFVKWKPVASRDVHCDSISYYRVLYKASGGEWREVIAGGHSVATRVTGLHFNTAYSVQVVAVNNQRLTAASETRHFVTPMMAHFSGGATRVSAAMIAGIVIAAVLLIVIVVVVLCCYRRCCVKYSSVPDKETMNNGQIQLNNYNEGEGEKEITPTGDSGVGVGDSPDSLSRESVAASPDAAPLPPVTCVTPEPEEEVVGKRLPIPVEQLEDYVMAGLENNKAALYLEYKEIRDLQQNIKQYGRNIEHKHKNRFLNIIPYDHSRVILDRIDGDSDSDYINASYIDGYKQPGHYIAAQGCNKFTIQDMWRMTWQVKSHRIVMATNLVENGRRKCEQYWPDTVNEEKLYGDIKVRLLDVGQTADFYMRTFDITRDDETRSVKQLHFTSWPDHGIPLRAGSILALRKKVRSFDETHPGPIIIHCSAGVGRTGSFIAIDYLLDEAQAEKVVDLYGLTQRMRKNRISMIQTAEQYVFVYTALVEALDLQDTAIACFEFRQRFAELCEVNLETHKSGLQEEFETLQSLPPKVDSSDCQTGSSRENQNKNRFGNILPADRHRPYLMTRVRGTNDYVNAVFLDGHRSRNAYIITQMPLPHTVIDFWRMVYEHKCGSIVMLNTWDDGDESYGQYWPDKETCECGPFVIAPVYSDFTNKHIIMHELKLTYQSELPQRSSSVEGATTAAEPGKSFTINQFQLKCWPTESALPQGTGEGVTSNVLIALSQLVEKSQLKTGNGPIVIHCHDGVRQSGLYATICCMWEKMKLDQEVDIFQTVKQHRYHRPHIIQDLQQYKFCYDMVLAYLAEFDTYSNFR